MPGWTSLCLFFAQIKTPKYQQPKTDTMSQKASLYPHTKEQSQSKRRQYPSNQKVSPQHKNTPCMILCKGRFNINR
jgi:hypothetical protein